MSWLTREKETQLFTSSKIAERCDKISVARSRFPRPNSSTNFPEISSRVPDDDNISTTAPTVGPDWRLLQPVHCLAEPDRNKQLASVTAVCGCSAMWAKMLRIRHTYPECSPSDFRHHFLCRSSLRHQL